MPKKNNNTHYYLVASPRRIYRVAGDIAEAEGFRMYFNLDFCDIHGPYYATSRAHAVQLGLESNQDWKVDSVLKRILKL